MTENELDEVSSKALALFAYGQVGPSAPDNHLFLCFFTRYTWFNKLCQTSVKCELLVACSCVLPKKGHIDAYPSLHYCMYIEGLKCQMICN